MANKEVWKERLFGRPQTAVGLVNWRKLDKQTRQRARVIMVAPFMAKIKALGSRLGSNLGYQNLDGEVSKDDHCEKPCTAQSQTARGGCVLARDCRATDGGPG